MRKLMSAFIIWFLLCLLVTIGIWIGWDSLYDKVFNNCLQSNLPLSICQQYMWFVTHGN